VALRGIEDAGGCRGSGYELLHLLSAEFGEGGENGEEVMGSASCEKVKGVWCNKQL